MSMFTKLFERKHAVGSSVTIPDFLREASRVSNDPLKISASLCAGLQIANGIASIPFDFGKISYDNKGRVIKTRTPNLRIRNLLTKRPNDYMTGMELVEHTMLHAIFEGVGRIYIERRGLGRKSEIIALHPANTNTSARVIDGRLEYSINHNGAKIDGLTRFDFIEITNPRWNAIQGLNIISELSALLKLSSLLETRQNEEATVKRITNYISYDKKIGELSVKSLKEQLTGLLNGAPILDDGAKSYSSIAHPRNYSLWSPGGSRLRKSQELF